MSPCQNVPVPKMPHDEVPHTNKSPRPCQNVPVLKHPSARMSPVPLAACARNVPVMKHPCQNDAC